MKKLMFLLAASFLMCACVKEGPPGPPGPSGRDGSTVNTYYIKVYPADWRPLGSFGIEGFCYNADFSMPAITNNVINKGAVLVYSLDGGYDNQLPYILPYQGFLETIRYDLSPGKIGFFIEDSDFRTAPPQGIREFKVVVVTP